MKLISEKLKQFNYLTSEIDAVYHKAALKFGLSDSAMMILYAVCSNGESSPISDIYKLFGVRKQTINSALRKLEAEGIVYLELLQGKKKNIRLTEKGKMLAENTVVRLIRAESDILNSWPKSEWEQYIGLTKRYLTAFQDKIGEF
ncbi:MAG: MarR family transcriptional regulator [Oscillospiraceae bacterium]|nr:MarR family transcriptional regulator [Oscillospiraceae bacterium]